jgi:hypothetical protein
MIITMFEEFKEDIQNQVSEFLENTYKKAWEGTETTKWTQRGYK